MDVHRGVLLPLMADQTDLTTSRESHVGVDHSRVRNAEYIWQVRHSKLCVSPLTSLCMKDLRAPCQLTLARVQVALAYVPALMASSAGRCSSSTTDPSGSREIPGDPILCGSMESDGELVTATRLRRIMQLKAASSGLSVL
jgi:hypothetical protein